MKCEFEQAVVRASAAGSWNESLRAHVSECNDCRAAAGVAPWMRRFAAAGERQHRLPDPQVVWLKARLLGSSLAAERATRPIRVVQFIAYITVAGGWAALLTREWLAIRQFAARMTPASVMQHAGAFTPSFFVLVFVLSSLTIGVALHTILAEE